jgi:hypothetical protein
MVTPATATTSTAVGFIYCFVHPLLLLLLSLLLLLLGDKSSWTPAGGRSSQLRLSSLFLAFLHPANETAADAEQKNRRQSHHDGNGHGF